MKRASIELLLGVDKFVVDDDEAHIVVNKVICASCSGKPCTRACPAACIL